MGPYLRGAFRRWTWDTRTIETELVELEKQYWQAIKDKDADAAMRLTDDPCIVTEAQAWDAPTAATASRLPVSLPPIPRPTLRTLNTP